jgi:hypothetical protein
MIIFILSHDRLLSRGVKIFLRSRHTSAAFFIKEGFMGTHLNYILKEMFNRVNLKFDQSFLMKKNWYLEKTWTLNEQNNFQKWLTDYLYTNRDARLELMTISYKNKKRCSAAASLFILNYGWKTE